MSLITPVILVGGSGKRLWPLSRESMPKQFVPLEARELRVVKEGPVVDVHIEPVGVLAYTGADALISARDIPSRHP